MNRISIIGALPESSFIGGVTIHVKRLLQGLDAKHVDYAFADYKSIGILRACLFIAKHRGCIHVHVTNPILLLIFVLVCKLVLAKCIFTLHANSGRFKDIKKLCLNLALRLADIPILINKRTYETYSKINKNARFIPAYIPPTTEEPLPEEVKDILSSCKQRGCPIVSTNASKYALDKDGNDIYGMDFLISYFTNLPAYTLLISDPKDCYRLRYPHTSENIVFISQAHSYYELLKHVDLFVRNTSTDGDALSVKEALSLEIPVLCSDIVDRPSDVILFKYSDPTSFTKALEKTKEQKHHTHSHDTEHDVLETLVKLYDS